MLGGGLSGASIMVEVSLRSRAVLKDQSVIENLLCFSIIFTNLVIVVNQMKYVRNTYLNMLMQYSKSQNIWTNIFAL